MTSRSARLRCFLACLALSACAALAQQPAIQQIPAFTAYSEPNQEALEIPESGSVTGWSDAHATLVWYGLLRTPGTLNVRVQLALPAGENATLRMQVDKHDLGTKQVTGSSQPVTVDFGTLPIKRTGGHRFALTGITHSGATFGSISSLDLSGEAAQNALFNHTPQRGAPSVHLTYPVPDDAQVEWFYNEVTAKKDPTSSYYEACGFARGYFGMQVNSPTERRIIFSVWDSGSEHDERDKVAEQNRVQLLAKGPDVFAGDFDHEGTGGHSHLVYPWKTGKTYRFLVNAQPQGDTTVYTGYFYFPEKHAWGMIASFRAPKDGHYLSHLYSFNEDFDGANGQQERLADFGNQWIRTTDGKWTELTKARFTHTGVGKYNERLDRAAGVDGKRFYLINGGFQPQTMEYGAMLERPSSGKMPDIVLPK